MPSQLNSGQLIANISSELADNNAGLISAYDVRHNLEDIAFSINKIVGSGDTEVAFPFFNAVKFSKADSSGASAGADHGDLIIESGVFFPNCDAVAKRTKRQTEPWLGDAGINHDSLDFLENDTHLQYYNRNGARPLIGNMSTDYYWINKSGINDVGFRFQQLNANATIQEIYVSGTMRWGDNSILNNAKGVAKAWVYFSASGANNAPVVYSWHNIHSISRKEAGKLKITFSSGVFTNNNFVAMGTSNGTSTNSNLLDMDVNTVSCIARSCNDGTSLRSVTYVIQDEGGQYVDGKVCSFVAYGYSPSESSGTPPTMIDESSAPTF
jgi:hypothetical protein